MKVPDLQRAHTIEEKAPSMLPVAEEKYSKINIYKNTPIKYNGSPFESRKNDRKKYPNEDAFISLSKDKFNSNSELSSEKSEEIYKRNEIINYISEPYYSTISEKRYQNKIVKRSRNIEENNQKRKESPQNTKSLKRHKKRKINVEIDKLEEPDNNYRRGKIIKKSKDKIKDEFMYVCEIPVEDERTNLCMFVKFQLKMKTLL